MTTTRPDARPSAPVAPRRRSWLEVRWRQFRNAPRPIVRAVLSSLVVASALGVLYLAYDVALTRGAQLPGGDLRLAFATVDVVAVLAFGTLITWLIVPAPRRPGDGQGAGTSVRGWVRGQGRSGWSAALGFFAAVPIAYLVLVVVVQVLKPLLT